MTDIFASTDEMLEGYKNGHYEYYGELKGRLAVFEAWLEDGDFDAQIMFENRISSTIKKIKEVLGE